MTVLMQMKKPRLRVLNNLQKVPQLESEPSTHSQATLGRQESERTREDQGLEKPVSHCESGLWQAAPSPKGISDSADDRQTEDTQTVKVLGKGGTKDNQDSCFPGGPVSRERHSQTCKDLRKLLEKQCPERSTSEPTNKETGQKKKKQKHQQRKETSLQFPAVHFRSFGDGERGHLECGVKYKKRDGDPTNEFLMVEVRVRELRRDAPLCSTMSRVAAGRVQHLEAITIVPLLLASLQHGSLPTHQYLHEEFCTVLVGEDTENLTLE
ncbi:uncharacterized protein RHO17_011398 [Thomomys bottae]